MDENRPRFYSGCDGQIVNLGNLRSCDLCIMTATVGHLGQLIAIGLVVLIGLGILMWASWKRRPPQQ